MHQVLTQVTDPMNVKNVGKYSTVSQPSHENSHKKNPVSVMNVKVKPWQALISDRGETMKVVNVERSFIRSHTSAGLRELAHGRNPVWQTLAMCSPKATLFS